MFVVGVEVHEDRMTEENGQSHEDEGDEGASHRQHNEQPRPSADRKPHACLNVLNVIERD